MENEGDAEISETDMLVVDTMCHHLMLKQNESHILLKDLIRNMFGYNKIFFFLWK
jgi:hypothetical protein